MVMSLLLLDSNVLSLTAPGPFPREAMPQPAGTPPPGKRRLRPFPPKPGAPVRPEP